MLLTVASGSGKTSPRRAVDMTDAEFEEFVTAVFWQVIEGGGNELQYMALTAWDERDCSALLRQWLDAGLISICVAEGWPSAPPPALPVSEAGGLLDRPQDWESSAKAAATTANQVFWVRASDAEWGREPSAYALLDDWSRKVKREAFDKHSAPNR
jgi:hypothetical protein